MSVHEQTISFPTAGGAPLAGYLAQPAAGGPHPALVVIHEAFGLNENIKGITRRFAAEGYSALAVDLFAGRNQVVCMFRFFGGMLFNSLEHGGIQDLKAALSWLTSQPGVDSNRLGAVGYCLGGSFAIAWACTDNRLKAIAPHYGFNPRPLGAVARVCPLVGSYPSGDITTEAGRRLDLALDGYQVPHDIKVYEGARHSFSNTAEPTPADSAAASDAWQRTLGFFREHIG